MTVARRLARAKLNLFLHVLGRRPDGYHELDSLIVFTDLADRVEAQSSPTLTLSRSGPFARRLAASLARDEDDLMLRAAGALDGARRAALKVEKNLPPSAGVGGGSSDAAATLRALDTLWNLNLGEAALARLAITLGADVPACLAQPEAVRIGGVGERLARLRGLPPVAVLVVNPGVGLATAEVFRAADGAWSRPAPESPGFATARDLAEWLRPLGNDLEVPAIRLAPVVDEVLSRLRTAPDVLLARMSGSGATCFALFEFSAGARAARDRLAAERPGWWCVATALATTSAGEAAP